MLFLITHWKAILFGIMIVGSFGAGWKFNSALEAEARANLAAEYELELDKEEERRALISMEYEEKLKTQKRKVKVIYKTVEKEVEKTVYKQCVIPPSGINLVRNTIEELNFDRGLETLDFDVLNEKAKDMNKDRKINILRPKEYLKKFRKQ
tara:strand:+ start:5217 stop:5669 length:453 start_codon:yes stop_codon:yes gene_type:complete